MKKIKEYVKEMIIDKKLYLFTIITFCFFGVYCNMQYAPDTYSVFSVSLKQTVLTFFGSGRIVTGIFFYILMGILKLSPNLTYIVSFSIAIICTILSLYRLYKLFAKDCKINALSCIAAILIIINIFSIELFTYIEKGTLMLSVLFCILAVEQIRNFFEGSTKSFLFALIFMLIASCCYQGTVALFVAISLLYIIKYSKNIKQFIVNNVIVAFAYGIPAIINFVLVRFIFTNSRVEGKLVLMDSMKKILDGTKNMFIGTYQLFPKYLFLVIIVLLIGYMIYKIIKKQETKNKKVLQILGIGYIILGATFVTIAPQLLQNTESIWFVSRNTYAIASIIGILLAYAMILFEIKPKEIKIIIAISCIILVIQFVYFTRYSIDNYIVNYQDKQNVKQIEEVISKYEQETGNSITKIAFYNDKNPSYTYLDIHSTGDLNIKALYPDWAKTAVIKYYTGRVLEPIQSNETIAERFKENDWNYYDKEQIILENDTIHLCNY